MIHLMKVAFACPALIDTPIGTSRLVRATAPQDSFTVQKSTVANLEQTDAVPL
jgi:hypothetical protein